MRPWARGLQVIAALALAFVAVSSIWQAVRQESWGPIAEGLWIPAVVVATCWPSMYRRCLPRRNRQAG
jgi:hypothetical protein